MGKIRVLLVDDHKIVREGLHALLEFEPGITVIGEAETGRQSINLARNLQPDVVVMDIAMPQFNGLEATRQIIREAPGVRILILSSDGDDEYIHQLTEAGAAGYLLKQSAAEELVKAIQEAHVGNTYFSPAISKRLLEQCREPFLQGRPPSKQASSLTSREAEVLQLIAEGRSNKQIAAELCISIKTVEKHRQQLMNKLNIHDIAGLTRYSLSTHVIESGSRLLA